MSIYLLINHLLLHSIFKWAFLYTFNQFCFKRSNFFSNSLNLLIYSIITSFFFHPAFCCKLAVCVFDMSYIKEQRQFKHISLSLNFLFFLFYDDMFYPIFILLHCFVSCTIRHLFTQILCHSISFQCKLMKNYKQWIYWHWFSSSF